MSGKRILLAALMAAVLPTTASAQYVSNAYGPIWNRFSLEPYAGRYYDNAGTAGARLHDSGWLGGLRLGLAVTDRVRLLGDVGFAQVDGVERAGPQEDVTVFGSESWLATAGVEVDVVPGMTRGSLSLLAGGVWRELRAQDGDAAAPVREHDPARVLVPGFAIRHPVAPRADLKLAIQDYIFVRDEPRSHNWALTAGLTIR